jgi:glucokinase
MKKYAIGVDIGGSHISCAVIDLDKKIILRESLAKQDVDNQASAEDILNNWAVALKKSLSFIDKEQLAGIGFAMPGPFDYENGIAMFTESVAKYQNLYSINVAKRLKEIMDLNGGSDVRFMNDASAFAIGEAWSGKAANVKRSVSITLGTGFGSAFVDDGVVVVEGDDVPKLGCVWHLPYNGGIADDSFSTRWFIKRYFEKSGIQTTGAKDISDRVSGDNNAKEVFIEFGTHLGEFLGPWLKKFQAEALVIGGNVTGAYKHFGKYFEEAMAKQNVKTTIHISGHMEDAAIIGSARMFDPVFWEKIKHLLSKM